MSFPRDLAGQLDFVIDGVEQASVGEHVSARKREGINGGSAKASKMIRARS